MRWWEAGSWWGGEKRSSASGPSSTKSNRRLVKSKAVRPGSDDHLPYEVSLTRWGEAWGRLTLASVAIQRRGFPLKAHKEEERGNEKGKHEKSKSRNQCE